MTLALSPPCSPVFPFSALKTLRLALALGLEWTDVRIQLGPMGCSLFCYYDYLLVNVYTDFWKELHTPLSCEIFFNFYFLAWALKGKLWEV